MRPSRSVLGSGRGPGASKPTGPSGLPQSRWSRSDGWPKQYANDPAIPGVTVESWDGKAYTSKSKWFDAIWSPHGGFKFESQRATHPFDASPGGLAEGVTDVAGMPTTTDSAKAAEWRVERRARFDPDYQLSEMPDHTEKIKPRIMPTGAIVALLRRTRALREQAAPVAGGEPQGADQGQTGPAQSEAGTAPPQGGPRAGKGPSRAQRVLTAHLNNIRAPLDRLDIHAPPPGGEKRGAEWRSELERRRDYFLQRGLERGKSIRSQVPQRPWEGAAMEKGQDLEKMDRTRATDAFGEAPVIPARSMWFYAWLNEWDTQIKIACPWDNRVLVHRSTADLPWVLEAQWGSPDAARELVKDCVQDFYEAAKKRGYLNEHRKIGCMIGLNGFWQARGGIMQGLHEVKDMCEFQWCQDMSPIPVYRERDFYPRMPPAPKVQMWRHRMRMNDDQVQSFN
eukprot:TRINITY_DN60163_c0_g1_i1.p1 TRINITY_DN60163_c0_g1~~TRINITY_DN60163_c0_g1_i1.p1  ORF type:complete len:452 (+),score=108.09 TRINITY_DN60163_c0_g1_i1:118-1473(+)